MSESTFRPVVYLKDRCPWCFRFRLFLLESGLQDRFDLRVFVTGDAQEAQVREKLAPHVEKLTFPTVEIAPGAYLGDSAVLVAHYAKQAGIAVESLALLDQYERGPLASMGEMRREVQVLRAQG